MDFSENEIRLKERANKEMLILRGKASEFQIEVNRLKRKLPVSWATKVKTGFRFAL